MVKKLGCFLHFLGSFLLYGKKYGIYLLTGNFFALQCCFSSLCIDAQIVVSVTKNSCSVFYLKKKKKQGLILFASVIG